MALRNIMLVRLQPGTTDEQVRSLQQALGDLSFPGRSNFVFGRDLGLREGNMDLSFSNDFVDEETYKAWADNAEHHQVREQYLFPIAERIERCQIQL